MRVMGVDPGTQKTGIGIVEETGGRLVPVFFETFKLKSSLTRHEKLVAIFDETAEIITKFQPDFIALEDVFFHHNFKSAIRLGEARSSVILASSRLGIEVFEYLPTRVKQATCGNGRAAKQQVQHMIRTLLGLKELPEEDAADALAVAICHLHSNKQIKVLGKHV